MCVYGICPSTMPAIRAFCEAAVHMAITCRSFQVSRGELTIWLLHSVYAILGISLNNTGLGGGTLNTMGVFNAAPPVACHYHPMGLPEKLFTSVPGSTIFFLFSYFLHFPFSFGFKKIKSEPTILIKSKGVLQRLL